ncbi:PepSY-associated TM helix domain-containing protein [Roseicella frigidaeris]|nr:PepSY-associated TM helix domain-containing protein [Roseicella frigidaeris]
MKQGFRQCMAWLHTWSGLLVGWILFAVFLTGTASYFRGEISDWMRPELHAPAAGGEPAILAIETLKRLAPDSPTWFVFPPGERNSELRVVWRNPPGKPTPPGSRGFGNMVLDPATGEPVTARESYGGEFFYRFHFQLHMPPLWGRWVVGFCAMMMLVAIISGVITHRRIFADFFTFRPGKGAGRSWLDAHNALAVLALPYHLMITYTGLITLMLMYMPWGVQAVYKGDRGGFQAEVFGVAPPVRRANQPAPLAPVGPLLEEAMRRWGGPPGRIEVQQPGDASAIIRLTRRDSEQISSNPQTLTFDGVRGTLLGASGEPGAAAATRGVAYGLHLGRFASPLVRALFVLSGLAGTAMVATGLVLWAAKQRHRHARAGRAGFGLRLVEALNLGTIAGLPTAMLGYFWANRLLPLHLADRADWEVYCFFLLWGLAALQALFWPGLRSWATQFAAAALLGLLLPVLNLLTTHRHLGVSLPAGDWAMAGTDLLVAAFGLLLGLLSWRLFRRAGRAPVTRPVRGAGLARAEGA